jgi:hypothetical protein
MKEVVQVQNTALDTNVDQLVADGKLDVIV